MRAIEFGKSLGTDGIFHSRYGESQFKLVDEFWYDFKPDGSQKTIVLAATLVRDSEENRRVVDELVSNSIAQKAANDEFVSKMMQILNKLDRRTQ